MRFDFCEANLHTSCEEHKYDHCEMCNIARAYQHGYDTAQEDMSIDAVEVVICKDCKYWHSNTEFCDIWSCMNVAQRTLSCDYCSRGELREKNEVEK